MRQVSTLIDERFVGRALHGFLIERFRQWDSPTWREAISSASLTVNEQPTTADYYLQVGDVISLDLSNVAEPDVNKNWTTIYRDEHLLVVNKPGNLPMHPAGGFYNNTLWYLLEQHLGFRPRIINRLDRETSGIVLIALDKDTAAKLGKQMQKREPKKQYDVFIHGRPEWNFLQAQGLLVKDVQSTIFRKQRFIENPCWQSFAKQGCRTDFTRLSTENNITHLRCRLHSGRMHQIRATLSSLGYPVVGDKLYGLDEQFYLRFSHRNLSEVDRRDLMLSRQALHAGSYSLRHPYSGEHLDLVAPMPKEMHDLF